MTSASAITPFQLQGFFKVSLSFTLSFPFSLDKHTSLAQSESETQILLDCPKKLSP